MFIGFPLVEGKKIGSTLGISEVFLSKSHIKTQWYEGDLKPLVKRIALAGVCWNMAIHVSIHGELSVWSSGRTEDVRLSRVESSVRAWVWPLHGWSVHPQPGLVLGVASPRVQHLALGFVEHHELPMVPLNQDCPSPSGWHPGSQIVSCTLWKWGASLLPVTVSYDFCLLFDFIQCVAIFYTWIRNLKCS